MAVLNALCVEGQLGMRKIPKKRGVKIKQNRRFLLE
jgi:hypothetical protein